MGPLSAERSREMKTRISFTAMLAFVLALFSGCASMQTWPDSERSAENKMVVIQEKIGDGLKTGALTPDQSQSFLTKLKVIRTDYDQLRDRRVYRDEWDSINGRLDALGAEIDRGASRTTRIAEPRSGDRIVALQRRIDDGRSNGHLSQADGRQFQTRLDSIRSDSLRMTEGGRSPSSEERADISRRLDMLEAEIDRGDSRTTRIEEPRSGEKIVALQRTIDDGRSSGRLPQAEGRKFQTRLDGLRSDHFRMTEGGRSPSNEERADTSRRLDILEMDLNRYR
jgi:hypothetical protein